jgi:hypothetical protein
LVRDTFPVPRQVPLTTLLSWVWIAHTIEVDNAFEAATSERAGRLTRISLPMWANGLRCVAEEGITIHELRSHTRALCNIGGLERWGWLVVGEGTAKRREGFGSHRGVKNETIVRPTRGGTHARRLWPRVVGEVEERWRSRFGADVVEALRTVLVSTVSAMPWSPPEVNPSDGFFTHVVDGNSDEDATRPLVVLLGQALTALTIEHERASEASLPISANLLRVIDSQVAPIRDLPALAGISKEGVAMGTGYLLRRGLARSEPQRAIRLTPAGLDALEDYRHLAASPTGAELRAALKSVVAHDDAFLAGLIPQDGCWRGERPYLTQTKRLLADPIGALPWHPMVLHRGGWPDAS